VLTDFRFAQKENLFRVEVHASRAVEKRFIYENNKKTGKIQFDFSGFEAEERVYELNNEILKQVKVFFLKGPEKIVRCQFDVVRGVSLAWVKPRGKVLTIAFERKDSAAALERPMPPDMDGETPRRNSSIVFGRDAFRVSG
jgi:hypothetical protein